MKPDTDILIVSAVAIADATMLPSRRGNRESQDRLTTGTTFWKHGLRFPTGDDAAGRKRNERLRQQLEAEGVITVVREHDKAVGFHLSSAADWYGRALAGRPGLRECLKVLQRLAQLHRQTGSEYVDELQLAGLKAYDAAGKWKRLVYGNEIALLAADYRSWVAGCSIGDTPDGCGCGYQLTPEGREALENPPRIGKQPKPDPAMVNLYGETLAANSLPRGYTEPEIENRRADMWEMCRRIACDVTLGRTGENPDYDNLFPGMYQRALDAERAANANDHTNWPGSENDRLPYGDPRRPKAVTTSAGVTGTKRNNHTSPAVIAGKE